MLLEREEGERGREKEKHVRERETLIGCFLYAPGPGVICAHTRADMYLYRGLYVSVLGIEPTT